MMTMDEDDGKAHFNLDDLLIDASGKKAGKKANKKKHKSSGDDDDDAARAKLADDFQVYFISIAI